MARSTCRLTELPEFKRVQPMKSLGYLCAALVVLWTSGCATKINVSQNRRVGVVAVIPDKVQTKYVGFWAFANKGEVAEMPGAQFAGTVNSTTTEALRASGFEVVPVAHNAAALWQKLGTRLNTMTAFFADNSYGDTERKTIGDELRSMAQANRLDAIVVVRPSRPTANGEATVGVGDFGFGLWAFGPDRINAYAMTQLTILQAGSLKTLASCSISNQQPVEGVTFEADFRKYPPDQQARMIGLMKHAYTQVVGKVLPRIVTR